ncbi:MAG: aspartate kinase [Candidatus Sumerlaeia bacterium]|nr:aspartate kinase [Candidatus Sumerlaeia bacterium]
MSLIVMKFGGDALGDKGKGASKSSAEMLSGARFHAEKFRHMSRIARERRDRGDRVLIVVSAMGDTTNRLLAMAAQLHPDPPARELDMLMTTGEQQAIALMAIALEAEGLDARSFTGPQVGIVTESIFGKARIREINPAKLRAALEAGSIPVVAGFQGATMDNELTTLGRGGSDITAVALAAALGADICEFYKDVDGVFTTDPRMCRSARKIDRISYDEMLELASIGAAVLHSRSVEFAKNYNVRLHVRSYLHDRPGTIVTAEEPEMEDIVVRGVAYNREESKITIAEVPDTPGVAAELFEKIAEANIIVDMVIQSAPHGGRNSISFTVPRPDHEKAMRITRACMESMGASAVVGDNKVAKLSIVGVGMRSHPNVAARMFRALADAGINIQMIATSEIKLSCIIDEAELEKGIQVVHDAFPDQVSEAAVVG